MCTASEHPQSLSLFLLSIRGTLSSATLEAAPGIHNSTAGAPPNVAAAQSLGDLSHMVYVPLAAPKQGAGEFLIMDVWNSMDGLNQFFANPHVQEQAAQIFASRDPVVWSHAGGFEGYHVPVPYGKNDRIVAIVRGTLKSRAEGKALHNAIVPQQLTQARRAGNVSHEAYLRLAPPNTPEALEFLAVDVWMNAEGMARHYADPDLGRDIMDLFSSEPSISTWTHPYGEWAEW